MRGSFFVSVYVIALVVHGYRRACDQVLFEEWQQQNKRKFDWIEAMKPIIESLNSMGHLAEDVGSQLGDLFKDMSITEPDWLQLVKENILEWRWTKNDWLLAWDVFKLEIEKTGTLA